MAGNDIKITTNAAALAQELTTGIETYQKGIAGTIFDALTILEAEIVSNIRSKSGLHVRSGSLMNSIGASKKVFVEAGNVVGTIGPEGIPYAAIHEFGGKTRPHIIRPRNGGVLAWMGQNGPMFARFVNHPGSNIPARPYLRPALAAKQDFILEHFGLFLKASFPLKTPSDTE